MPPRFAYWTILAGGLPTAFRATERDELLPTFHRLRERHPDAELKYFARGRLWNSREESQLARENTPQNPSRGRAWRPGGEHRDPRQRFDDERKAKNQARRQERWDRTHGSDKRTRPPGDVPRDRPPQAPAKRPFEPRSQGHGSDRFPRPKDKPRSWAPPRESGASGAPRGGNDRQRESGRPPRAPGATSWRPNEDRRPKGRSNDRPAHGSSGGDRPPRASSDERPLPKGPGGSSRPRGQDRFPRDNRAQGQGGRPPRAPGATSWRPNDDRHPKGRSNDRPAHGSSGGNRPPRASTDERPLPKGPGGSFRPRGQARFPRDNGPRGESSRPSGPPKTRPSGRPPGGRPPAPRPPGGSGRPAGRPRGKPPGRGGGR